MSALRIFRSRKYLQRILIYICLAMVLLVGVSSYTVYYNAENTVLNMQYEANQKVLSQMNYNISYMNEMIKTMATSVFFDTDMVPMMYGVEGADYFDMNRGFSKINTAVGTSSFLDSIVVYNGMSDKFYSTANMPVLSDRMYAGLRQVLEGDKPVPKMKLIPMSLQGNGVEFFSFIVYESLGDYKQGDSALILNIKSKWLFDNVKLINKLEIPDHSGIYLMDAAGTILNPEPSADLQAEELKPLLAGHIKASNQEAAYFTASSGGDKYVVTYMQTDVNGWKIVTVKPFNSILGFVTEFRTVTLISIASFLVLTVILAFFVSHRLYKPIERLMKQIKGKPGDGDEEVGTVSESDELAYLSHAYDRVYDKMSAVMQDKHARKEIVKQYYMKQILTGSEGMSEAEFAEIVQQHQLHVAVESGYRLCVIGIDRLKQFEESRSAFEKKTLRFAIMNIAEETIGSAFRIQLYDSKSDHFAVLISGEPKREGGREALIARLHELQQVIAKYYHLSLSAAVSDEFNGYSAISKHYNQTLHELKYRIIFGEKAVITPEMVAGNEDHPERHIAPEAERQFGEAIKSGNGKLMLEQLNRITDQAVQLHYDQLIHAMLRLTVILNQTFKEIASNRIRPLDMDLTGFTERVLEKETLEEMAETFRQTLTELASGMADNKDDQKTAVIVQAIKDMIDQNYVDMDLSLQKVASALKLSTSYVGKLFNSSESMSVAEYITAARLRQALKLLEEKDYTIQEVMSRSGFSSESNFYKLFKKRFGTTPKEYRVKRMLG
ncbi:AraC family transcriptional regulator [Paenibacillus silvisoli]|uniref:AraC family transcriptional regulator n=1 Tax=Paenibacillus silvisoli TaxID=3110539 RepID=UPI002805E076|nr:AraC family transcriptional regulator [Paenibacillus silvisoli]